ncbi:MAG: DUF6273 domain-containing protein [Clostridiales bacterium]|nr:DUF6273 domain-containing protein [Clostridiales bacterium]
MRIKRTIGIKTDEYMIGAVIAFKLKTGEKVQAMAMERIGNSTLFLLVDCLNDEAQMNATNTTEGGYEKSDLRKWLNKEVLSQFPTKIRKRMVQLENGDYLSIPAKANIFGTADKECWEPMKKRRNRIAYHGKDEELEWYWLRDVVSASGFANVSNNGNASYGSASGVNGVRPFFLIS